MSALTDTYIDAVVRRLPDDARTDIADEIRATIEDMVSTRVEGGEARDGSERAVLEELGDPVVLSRAYTNSPQQLIGPNSYPLFIWCLRWLLPVVGLIALTANAIVTLAVAPEAQLGAVLGKAIGNTVVALLVAFAAVTILIAIGDRGLDTGAAGPKRPGRAGSWSVDDLRSADPSTSTLRAEAVLGLVFIVVFALVPLVPTTFLYVGHLNGGETFVNPDLAPGWLVGYWVFLGLLATVTVVRLIRGRAQFSLLIADSIVDIAFAVFLTIAFLTQQVLHPEITTAAWAGAQQIIAVIAIWGIVIWEQIVTWRQIVHARRGR